MSALHSRWADRETAKRCLEAAAAAYEDTDGFSYMAAGCKVCVTRNLLTDLQFQLVPYSPGEGCVHEGFFQAFKELQVLLDELLDGTLYFTGHSLGGALATLAALHAATRGLQCICITFGCPKVGDQDFVRFYQRHVPHTMRYINKFDPVPRLLQGAERPSNDAEWFHWMLGKLLKFSQLAGGEYAHVCDAVQLDTGAIASINHWRAFVGSLASLAGGPDHRQTAWRKALVPHDVSIYKQNLSQKESFNFGSMQDLEILLQCIKGCPSPVLLAAAAAAALAILALWRMQGKNGPEVHELQKELSQAKPGQSAEDLPLCCDALHAQLELDLAANKEDLWQQLDVLCQATAVLMATGGEGDLLKPWHRLAPLLGRFLWNCMSDPGQWMELVPSMHHFQDMVLDSETLTLAPLAWAPDNFQVRVTMAFSEKILRETPLPPAAEQWFSRYAMLVPDLPNCSDALSYDSTEPMSRLIAVKTLVVFIAEFMHCWPPSLLVAILRCMHRLVQDPNQEVKDAAAESLAEATHLVGLEPLLQCSQDIDLHRDATALLKDLWEHSTLSPCWVIKELQNLQSDASCGHAAEEALCYLRERAPKLVKRLEAEDSESDGTASGDSMAGFILVD